MTTSGDRAGSFEKVWSTLGLDGVADRVPHDATITARTLAAHEAAKAPAPNDGSAIATDRTVAAIGDARVSRETFPTLPHIRVSNSVDANERQRSSQQTLQPDLEITRVLGEGGMGRVHLARQRSLRRDVAIKTLKTDVGDPGAVEALLVEALAMGSLEHPNIVPVHALGRDDAGLPVLVMKRIEGTSWSERLRARVSDARRDSERQAEELQVLVQVCHAVEYAHSRGVVHRDIKPENVMVGAFGQVYLMDWGIAAPIARARSVSDGAARTSIVGTPAYMAPEMVGGDAPDARTDVYLLGATLHEIVTGEPRHAATTLHEVLLQAYLSEPHAYGDEVPAELAAICNRATAADRNARFPDVASFREAIVSYLGHRSAIALTNEALARLEALRTAIADDVNASEPERVRRVHEVFSEARFGFIHALRTWGESPGARAGLQRCLETMIEFEIAHGNDAGADALLAELPERRADLDARVAELRRAADERRARANKLDAIEHDLDLSVGLRARNLFLALVGAAVVLVAVGVGLFGPQTTLTHRGLIGIGLGMNAVIVVTVALFRRRLFANAVSRKIVLLFVSGSLMMLLDRLFQSSIETPVVRILPMDLFILGTTAIAGGVTIEPWLAALSPILFTGCAVGLWHPEIATVGFSVTTGLTVIAAIIGLTLSGRRTRRG